MSFETPSRATRKYEIHLTDDEAKMIKTTTGYRDYRAVCSIISNQIARQFPAGSRQAAPPSPDDVEVTVTLTASQVAKIKESLSGGYDDLPGSVSRAIAKKIEDSIPIEVSKICVPRQLARDLLHAHGTPNWGVLLTNTQLRATTMLVMDALAARYDPQLRPKS